jgi:preprotein translocase subunit YajC
MHLNFLLADATPPQGSNLYQTLMLLGFGILFFYFLLWRPEQKRRKSLEKTRNSIKKGDKVIAMGILGSVVAIKENSVILKMVDNSQIEVLKTAISDAQPATAAVTEVVDSETVQNS